MQKNESVLSICSGEIVDLKILQSNWLSAFWPISQELYRNTSNKINFHYKTNSVKITKFFFKFKKPFFWPISSISGVKFFSKLHALSHTPSQRFLAPCQNSEKSNDPIPRKHLHRRRSGRMCRPYFIGPFQLTPEVLQVKLQ